MCSRYLRLLDLSSSLLSSLPPSLVLFPFISSSLYAFTRVSRVLQLPRCCCCCNSNSNSSLRVSSSPFFPFPPQLRLSFSWRDSSNNESKYCVAFVQAVFSSEDRINDTFADILIIRITSRSVDRARFISFVVTYSSRVTCLDYYKSASECSMNRFLDSFERICYLYIWEIFQV